MSKLTNQYMANAAKFIQEVDKYGHDLDKMSIETRKPKNKIVKRLRELRKIGFVPTTQNPEKFKAGKLFQIRLSKSSESDASLPDDLYEELTDKVLAVIRNGGTLDIYHEITRFRFALTNAAMIHCDNNIAHAAKRLGMIRTTLQEFLARYGQTGRQLNG